MRPPPALDLIRPDEPPARRSETRSSTAFLKPDLVALLLPPLDHHPASGPVRPKAPGSLRGREGSSPRASEAPSGGTGSRALAASRQPGRLLRRGPSRASKDRRRRLPLAVHGPGGDASGSAWATPVPRLPARLGKPGVLEDVEPGRRVHRVDDVLDHAAAEVGGLPFPVLARPLADAPGHPTRDADEEARGSPRPAAGGRARRGPGSSAAMPAMKRRLSGTERMRRAMPYLPVSASLAADPVPESGMCSLDT